VLRYANQLREKRGTMKRFQQEKNEIQSELTVLQRYNNPNLNLKSELTVLQRYNTQRGFPRTDPYSHLPYILIATFPISL